MTTLVIQDPLLCSAVTKSGTFCKNKKKIGDVCSLHSKNSAVLPVYEEAIKKPKKKDIPTSEMISVGKKVEKIALSSGTVPNNIKILEEIPNLCKASNKNGDSCKNKIKKGNRLYCQVHSKA